MAVTANAICGGCLFFVTQCECTPAEKIEGWRVACDHPGCRAFVRALGQDDERAAIEASLDLALAYGWQIASDRFIRPREDLCPDHRTSEE